ncbi:hypothetical protein Dimus_034224, partial [Dionaea muscipula]
GKTIWEVESGRGSWEWKNLLTVRNAIIDFVDIGRGWARWKAKGTFCPDSVYRALIEPNSETFAV